ncbi:MAG: type II toxin-antitoxin system RelE/ParE family toxin [Trueperaceae bacterium]|nr:type II toxin-antitoxin system RelE/ParE family toxin [Trueperaceae bacterium]MCC6311892.1 type II toxin-antitoxin system RelE/ParE family toxin [Trueperaceae bacterium]MCO5175129.1 type II toxin-antitoxin system RelE/ParE family toxin [Trueperaceae bacterium]MCW5820546.1 type II toxin-antitoxin system RelE/ParE family toxin [Trueperaceae bacterium]
MLSVLASPQESNLPGYDLHQLKGNMKGYWSITANGNWRVTFKFAGTDVDQVDYVDYH